MAPWAQAVFDTLGAVASKVVIEEVLQRGLLEVLPLTHSRPLAARLSSSSTKLRVWSATCCSPSSAASARIRGWY